MKLNINIQDRLTRLGEKAILIRQAEEKLKQLEDEYKAEEQQLILLQQIEASGLEITDKTEAPNE